MKKGIFDDIVALIEYASTKGLELSSLVENNYFDKNYVADYVCDAKERIEKRVGDNLGNYTTFYDLLCKLDETYHLAYTTEEDKIITDFRVKNNLHEYTIYYLNSNNISFRRFNIDERKNDT